MSAILLSKINFERLKYVKEDLRLYDDLVIDLSRIFTFVQPQSDIRQFSLEITLMQLGEPYLPAIQINDGEYGNNFSEGIVFAVIPNEQLDSLRRGFYQIAIRATIERLTRSYILPNSLRLSAENFGSPR